jgi:hypothetical protein
MPGQPADPHTMMWESGGKRPSRNPAEFAAEQRRQEKADAFKFIFFTRWKDAGIEKSSMSKNSRTRS